MSMTAVNINGETYLIPNEKLQELLDWVSKNSVQVEKEKKSNRSGGPGSCLLNE